MAGTVENPQIEIRALVPTDDLDRIAALVRAAYSSHANMGLRFWGTRQTAQDTRQRFSSGIGLVMLEGDDYIGTAIVRPPQPESPVPLYRNPAVWSLSQFCISPRCQGRGFGRLLHSRALELAARQGARSMALDTAAPAKALIAMYEAWGYRVVGTCDWRPDTNYESVVMSLDLKPMPERPADIPGTGVKCAFSILTHDNIEKAERTRQIMAESYAEEARLLGIGDFPPLRRTAEEIFASDSIFIGCMIGSELVAVAEVEANGAAGQANVAAFTVLPRFFRRGVGKALLDEVVLLFRERSITVSTAAQNFPAAGLYAKAGFRVVTIWRTPDGIDMVTMRRTPADHR